MALARKKKPGEKKKEVGMNEMERDRIVEAMEAKEAVQRVYSEGFAEDFAEGFGNEAGTGENAQAHGFVGVRDLLNGVLRPRLVSKGKDPNWEETYFRLVHVYDILLSNVSLRLGEEALEGTVSAVMDPDNYFIDLTEVFYELFPQARNVNVPIPGRSLRPNILLVMDDNLTSFLSPDNLREKFGRLVEGTRFDFRSPFAPSRDKGARAPRAEKRNPNFLRFREAISLAARSLGENLSEEQARSILHEVLESYLSYAQNIRSLPKPEVELEG
jgi:hypothetical protein